MSVYGVKLPDVGEGVAEAELVQWLVAVGDAVTTESSLAEVLTDKTTIEVVAPVNGVVAFLVGEPGDMVAVGSDFVGIETVSGNDTEGIQKDMVTEGIQKDMVAEGIQKDMVAEARPTASPAVRQRARELGLDLSDVAGTGDDGRVVHADLDRVLTVTAGSSNKSVAIDTPRIEQVRGVRRRIAERLTQAWTEIPHITYVEEIDATNVEALRTHLNGRTGATDRVRLTLLPFLVQAVVLACREQPRLNAHYDAENGSLSIFEYVHIGVATQTPDGLVVPVVRHAESLTLWDTAREISRLALAARDGRATREELSGSTVTITSLGALGGVMTTPIINRPEVAIVGVNKMEVRPMWHDNAFVPRQMFNLSSSFDHRIVDGWDAATFVQKIKTLLETPALMFIVDR